MYTFSKTVHQHTLQRIQYICCSLFVMNEYLVWLSCSVNENVIIICEETWNRSLKIQSLLSSGLTAYKMNFNVSQFFCQGEMSLMTEDCKLF